MTLYSFRISMKKYGPPFCREVHVRPQNIKDDHVSQKISMKDPLAMADISFLFFFFP